jgi:hypothetical protein
VKRGQKIAEPAGLLARLSMPLLRARLSQSRHAIIPFSPEWLTRLSLRLTEQATRFPTWFLWGPA